MKKSIANFAICWAILVCLYILAADPIATFLMNLSAQYVANLVIILLVLPVLIALLIKVNPGLTKFFK